MKPPTPILFPFPFLFPIHSSCMLHAKLAGAYRPATYADAAVKHALVHTLALVKPKTNYVVAENEKNHKTIEKFIK